MDLYKIYFTVKMKDEFTQYCPKLLRIFGKQQELADFPLPGFIVRNFVPLNGAMQEISLHYLIRNESNSHSNSLKTFDREFKRILDDQQQNSNSRNNTVIEDNRKLIHEMILVYEETVKQVFHEIYFVN